MREPDEANLIARCQSGEADAWDALFTAHHAPVFRFVFQLGFQLSHEDCEEICQEAFLAVVRNLASFKGGCAFQTWLFRIAANKAKDYIGKQSAAKRGGGQSPLSLDATDAETGLGLDIPDAGPAPDHGAQQTEQMALLVASVEQLEEPCREIIQLRYFGELSYGELAHALELNPKTVSSRLSRCLDRLEYLVKDACAREMMSEFPV